MTPATYHSVPESPVGYPGRLRIEQAERLQLVRGTPMIRPGLRQYPTVEAWRRSRERRRQDPSACSTPGCRFRRHTSGVLYEDLTDDGGIVEYLCCWRCRLSGGEAHGEMCEFLRLPHPGPVMWESFELPPHPGPPPPGPVLHEHDSAGGDSAGHGAGFIQFRNGRGPGSRDLAGDRDSVTSQL